MFESLPEIMNANRAGILVIRDEVSGWLAGMERQGREQERAFFLESLNGDTSFGVDRNARGYIHAERTAFR